MKKIAHRELFIPYIVGLESAIESTIEFSHQLGLDVRIYKNIEGFFGDLKTFVSLPTVQQSSSNIELVNNYIDQFFGDIIRLCSFLDDKWISKYHDDLWGLFDQLGEKIPWTMLSADRQLKYFKGIFKHKTFRTEFIAFYTGGEYVCAVTQDFSFSVPRTCYPNLFTFLKAWNELEKGTEPLSDEVLARLLPTSTPDDNANAGARNADKGRLLEDNGISHAPRWQESSHTARPNPSKFNPTTQSQLDEAWKTVQDTSERVQVLDDFDDEGQRDLADAQKVAHNAYTQPTQQAVKELKNLSQKFQQKSSSCWVALGLALLGLALTIAGALAIAVSIGALHTGFFAPPGAAGAVGGLELMGVGLATLGAAAVSFGESPEPERQLAV